MIDTAKKTHSDVILGVVAMADDGVVVVPLFDDDDDDDACTGFQAF